MGQRGRGGGGGLGRGRGLVGESKVTIPAKKPTTPQIVHSSTTCQSHHENPCVMCTKARDNVYVATLAKDHF